MAGKEADFRDSTESLDQIGTTVEYAVNLNKTLNTTLDDSSVVSTPAPLSSGRPESARPSFATAIKDKVGKRRKKTQQRLNNDLNDTTLSTAGGADSDFLENSKYFKKPLGSYYDHNSLVYPGLVPVFIKEIVQKLEENSHLETEGLYRVPADRKKRRELLEYFDSSYKIGGTMDFSELKDGPPAPNTLAGCIQWYISSKNLPEPIIPVNFPKKLQGAMEPKSESEKIEKLRLIFTELGAEREAHWQTLKYLFQHFLRVSQCSQVNQMHARNIATCLFPTFFPPDASNFSPATFNTDSCIFIDILVLLIEHGDSVFGNDPILVKELKETIANQRVNQPIIAVKTYNET